MNYYELSAFIVYFAIVIAVGLYFFFKSKGSDGEREYFLGGRNMNGFVAALSAGASDMSAWVLMGLPGSIYLWGIGQIWISIGLLLGTICSWIFIAPKLRKFSIKANDSITIPQYLTNRFKESSPVLQIICAIVFVVVYCVYTASSISACGTLFNQVFGVSATSAMIVAAAIIVLYTFLGGFKAVCWTDFFQGMLMLAALMVAPIIALFVMNAGDWVAGAAANLPENYYNILSSGSFNWESIANILSGFGWGLGYFGMPHIIIRYMSIRSEKEMKKSQIIGCTWTTLILFMASVVGIVGRHYLGDILDEANRKLVFINMVRGVFPALIAGVLLSAILAASMSSADSQLLASSSAFASDVYKPVIRKKASKNEVMWAGRIVVVVIAIIALIIATLSAKIPTFESIMGLVECAWGAFGAAFGPVIILSLYWRRLTFKGAIAGIVCGFAVDALWYAFLSSSTGLYEIIPGFITGLIAAVVVSLIDKAPSKEVCELFDSASK
ncbi:MAG: sodium/proline symporter PutP [Lachnospiraceae bacterium]|nr:sodium/proline symporter PutP [Lachnospiraceae bacterium]